MIVLNTEELGFNPSKMGYDRYIIGVQYFTDDEIDKAKYFQAMARDYYANRDDTLKKHECRLLFVDDMTGKVTKEECLRHKEKQC